MSIYSVYSHTLIIECHATIYYGKLAWHSYYYYPEQQPHVLFSNIQPKKKTRILFQQVLVYSVSNCNLVAVMWLCSILFHDKMTAAENGACRGTITALVASYSILSKYSPIGTIGKHLFDVHDVRPPLTCRVDIISLYLVCNRVRTSERITFYCVWLYCKKLVTPSWCTIQ